MKTIYLFLFFYAISANLFFEAHTYPTAACNFLNEENANLETVPPIKLERCQMDNNRRWHAYKCTRIYQCEHNFSFIHGYSIPKHTLTLFLLAYLVVSSAILWSRKELRYAAIPIAFGTTFFFSASLDTCEELCMNALKIANYLDCGNVACPTINQSQ